MYVCIYTYIYICIYIYIYIYVSRLELRRPPSCASPASLSRAAGSRCSSAPERVGQWSCLSPFVRGSLSLSLPLSRSLSLSFSPRASIAQLVDSSSCLRKDLSLIPASATTEWVTKKPLPSKSAEESQT